MRNRPLDIAKAIGIILVVIGHFFPAGSPHWYEIGRQVIYSFHMPLFVFISGFVYIYAYNDSVSYGTVLAKKFRRIALPYFMVSFAFIAIKLLMQILGVYLKNPVSAESFLRVFWQPEAAVSFWYLWALWWFYMIVPLFRTRKSRLLLFVLVSLISVLPLNLPDIFSLPKTREMFPYFMLGALMADWDRDWTVFRRLPTYVWYLLFAVCVLLWQCLGIRLGIVLALSGAASVICVSESLVRLIDRGHLLWLDKVSRSSYLIYLLHPIFIAAVLALIHKAGPAMSNEMFFIPAMCLACFLAVTGPMLVGMILKKIFDHGR